MDFFAEQDRARRNTRRLLLLFALAVVVLIALTNLAVALGVWLMDAELFGQWDYVVNAPALDGARPPPGFLAYLSLPMFLGIGAVVSTGVALASGVRHLQLARGGAVVAEMLNGTPLDPASSEPAERRLLNVVEEMAIASGVPVPAVYRVPGEGINAFAAGYAPDDAVIGVTDGALVRLGRDELQGVMGHEFSHILNGDMRLNLRLIAVLHGILFIAQAGRLLLEMQRRGSSRDKGDGALVAMGLMLLLLGSGGVFFGRLIKAGVSREREFLADAAAVQFTRNPLGLAGALRKIGGLADQGAVASPRAEEASHLFFAQAIGTHLQSWFATHPPLARRIRRLDPTWNGKYEPLPADAPAAHEVAAEVEVPGVSPIAAPGSASDRGTTAPDALYIVDAEPANDAAPHGVQASPIAGLSGALRAACREADSAAGVVLAALIDPQVEVAARQHELIECEGFAPPAALAAELRDAPVLPVLELAMPALGRLEAARRAKLWGVVERMVALDGHLDLRELAAAVLLQRHLCEQTGLVRATRARYRRLEQLAAPLSVLYSALVLASPAEADARFAAAAQAAGLTGLRLLRSAQPDWPMVHAALQQLRGLFPLQKPRVLKGCRAALAMGVRGDEQAEALFGLLAATLDCPASPQLVEPLTRAG
jgi:Zn-dependent protease with chaperone function